MLRLTVFLGVVCAAQVLLANHGQANSDVEKVVEIYSEIDGNINYVSYCNTLELRSRVSSFISECDKSYLEENCGSKAKTLLEELKECKEDKEDNDYCRTVDVDELPQCLQLLKKEWEALREARAPCKNSLDENKYQHVMTNCQQLEGKDEDAQYDCLGDFYDLLFHVDTCWNIVNLDLASEIKSMKEIENRMAQQMAQFRGKGYKACIFKSEKYLNDLQKYVAKCDNAQTEEKRYECSKEAASDYGFISADADYLGSRCTDYEKFVKRNAGTGLNQLFNNLQKQMAVVAKNIKDRKNYKTGRAFYSAAEEVVQRWTSEKSPEKKKELQADILDATWGLLSVTTGTRNIQL